MKSQTILSVTLLVPGLASAAICNNNCGRAVAGTARKDPPFASRSSLCAAFVTAAVQPIIGRNVHVRRQDAPEPIITGTKPAYASSCPDSTAYWSACQCIEGIQATGITVSGTRTTPVTSATVTTIRSPSTTVSAEESTVTVPSGTESSTISDDSETATVEPSASSEPLTSSESSDTATLEPSRTSDTSDTITQDPTSFITSQPDISTSTAFNTGTTTSISSAPNLPICTPGPSGLEFAIYAFEPSSPECREVLYTSPSRSINLRELLMGRTPDATGLTPGYRTIGLRRSSAEASSPVEYNGVRGPENSTFECNVIQHRGYIQVSRPGTFAIIPDTPDDIILIWVGDNARSGQFAASNSNKSGRCCSTPSSFNFTVGPFDGPFKYIPYRIFFANAAGPGGFGVTAVALNVPAGPFLFANCTGEENLAPSWPPWQVEEYASN